MEAKFKQSGLTLTEMVVVVAIIALLVGLGVPAGRAFLNSFETESGTRSMISAALASARAIAAKEQHYAGIRFQQDLDDNQYMVFIVHDFDKTGLANGFRAAEGLKPIKLPDSVGVMDLKVVNRTGSRPHVGCEDNHIDLDSEIDDPKELTDTTAFSIIFSPSGKLVKHKVEMSNRDGVRQPTNLNDSMDDIFNSPENIAIYKTGMFIQDDYFSGSPPDLGLGPELSRSSFIIYDRRKFRRAYEKGQAYSDYLVKLVPEAIYINPYTGTIISAD